MPFPVLSTYRLQMRGDALHLRRRRGAAALPRRSGCVAPVPVPDPDRDDRARHTGTTSPIQPRSRRNSAAPKGWRGCRRPRAHAGMGLIVDIVPNHVGVGDPRAEPVVVGRPEARQRLGVLVVLRHRLDAGRRPNRVAGAGFRRRRRRSRRRRRRSAARRPRAIPSRREPVRARVARCTTASTTG